MVKSLEDICTLDKESGVHMLKVNKIGVMGFGSYRLACIEDLSMNVIDENFNCTRESFKSKIIRGSGTDSKKF